MIIIVEYRVKVIHYLIKSKQQIILFGLKFLKLKITSTKYNTIIQNHYLIFFTKNLLVLFDKLFHITNIPRFEKHEHIDQSGIDIKISILCLS